MAENLKTETAWKRRLPWIAAIVLGTLSILAVNKYLTLQQGGSEQKKVFLLAASADIKPDQELTRNDLEIRSFPAESVSGNRECCGIGGDRTQNPDARGPQDHTADRCGATDFLV